MQEKIAFGVIFLFIDEDFSRAEPQSAPQNATSVSGTPQSITDGGGDTTRRPTAVH